jgi:hypothetical protein
MRNAGKLLSIFSIAGGAVYYGMVLVQGRDVRLPAIGTVLVLVGAVGLVGLGASQGATDGPGHRRNPGAGDATDAAAAYEEVH